MRLLLFILLLSCTNIKTINSEPPEKAEIPVAEKEEKFEYQIEDIVVKNGKVKFIKFETHLDNGLYEMVENLKTWLSKNVPNLQNRSNKDIYELIETECEKHPGMSFGISYVAGLFAGRILRHLDKPSKSIQRFKFQH